MALTRILSIDGGGIRGLIPALVLEEIERRTGKPAARLFDLIAGTSTGGILAAGLCVPGPTQAPRYPAHDLVSLYREHGQEIFHADPVRRITSLFFGPQYSASNLEAQLLEKFGEARLADAVTGLLITSFEMHRGQAWFFSRETARKHPERNYLLREIARATSAAPTYFAPARIAGGDGKNVVLVDGGVFANNPTMCAWVDGHEGVQGSDDVMVLSLGCGSVPHRATYSRARRWGRVSWAQPVIGAFLDGQADTVDYQVGQLLEASRYLRLQVDLPLENGAMDDASAANVQALAVAASRLLEDPEIDRRLTDFCRRLEAGV